MNGYVMNASPMWMHAMKRSIGPGAKVTLDELFDQYGVKHGINEGSEFVEWLRSVKLKDPKRWKIVLDEGEKSETDETKIPSKKGQTAETVAPMVKTELDIKDIVGLSVRNAREQLPKITDLKLLKYAFQEANQLAGKDSLCKVIRKRIRDLQIAR